MLKSPLRYPGGKSKAINQIVEYLPENFDEFREPFVGGGSVFIYLKQKFPKLKIWINDLNRELFLFWKFAQSHLPELVKEIRYIKAKYTDGKLLFTELATINVNHLSDFDRAVRFFVLNRITFSGTVESGGFSQEAFHKRFTNSSIERLEKLETILTKNVEITNLDYSYLLPKEGEKVFLFLDPPYFIATKSKLYGKYGNLHTSFQHQRFAELLQQCHHRWLITYDDSPQIRENFQWANISEWQLQYGMNNYKQSSAAKGKELFITNYKLKLDLHKKLQN
ncbi:modification methylase [Nostoc linckia z18]|uniref:Modification methylase n=2 Tax=Nostoc linckia TaxID=92942 RepID=A0A9Q5ZFS2_NOSLI|nr:DNA adenine methylase [Nostoc linckia]PHK30583.1 modification methylase [Nostoc linckia z15]PHK45801.1 modification methylase [Nostoc linckia z16]PHJ64129.1 modification methylase [Nostoc linckia z1]PHJ69762.1 modification methylase [Nostoc linckia z3]PHJ75879.1 modification methylase [Nostoc linckia z2]